MITNTAQYMAVMGQASQNALEFCIEKCYEDLQKKIESGLYGAYSPSDYARTGEMLNAWKRIARQTDALIMFHPALLSRNPDLGQHTSIMGAGALSYGLLDVLESGYKGFNAHTGKQIPARPFWEQWLQSIGDKPGRWYAQGLRAQGLTVIG